MKIYPCKHKIKSIPTSKIDTDLNIPLAYIDIDYTKYNISKIVDPNFSTNKKTILYPEQEFDNKNFLLFNEFEETVNDDGLFILRNGKYKFYPSNTIKFSPKYFLWKATVKKNFKYSISNNYNIKIACSNNTDLNRNLITTFMNPSKRNMLVYNNIKINSDNIVYNVFEDDGPDTDFMFIKTHNCKHYDIDNTKEINIYNFLSEHINLWLGCESARAINDSFEILTSTVMNKFSVASPIVSNNASIVTNHYFDLSMITPPSGVTIHNIFNSTLVPVLILEYSNAGFVIISSYDILDNPVENEGFMYEIMMYVYCNTYMSTPYIKDWITYDIPNYEVKNGVYTTKTSFVSNTSVSNILNLNGAYELVKVDISDCDDVRILDTGNDLNNTNGNIKYIGQNNGKPIFAIDGTLDGYTEPKKPVGWKSIYSNGYIYYIEKLYSFIEEDITDKIVLLESENDLIVKLYSFKSSSLNINKQADTTIKIPFIKTDGELIQRIRESEYVIFYNKITSGIKYCFLEDYKDSDDYIKLFNVLVEQTNDAISVYDMRQLGGGLSEDEPDNFELLDIGHINGRPYRIAGSLVLTMPTKYKPYEEQILKAINKYRTAEDYIAVFFEDKEDDDY